MKVAPSLVHCWRRKRTELAVRIADSFPGSEGDDKGIRDHVAFVTGGNQPSALRNRGSSVEPSIPLLFAIGLFSSTHCIGMCGSIAGALALSLPLECRQSPRCLARFLAAYNLGRIISYGLAGGVGGLIGSVLSSAEVFPVAHEAFRIFSAAVIVAAGLYLTGWVPQLKQMDRLGEPLWRRLEPLGRKLLPVRRLPHALLFGVVWGWLPCGLVYYALLLTLSAGNALQGALYMLVFGLGTLPAVALMGSATGWFAGLARHPALRQATGLVLVGIGIVGLVFGQGIL